MIGPDDEAALRRIYEEQPTRDIALATVEPAVVRWAWTASGGQLLAVEPPLADELGVNPEGPLLDEKPEVACFSEYGFDAHGRCVVARVRRLTEDEGERLDEEKLLTYGPSSRETAHYERAVSDWALIEVSRRTWDGELVIRDEFFRDYTGLWAFEYGYDEGRVIQRAYYESASMDGGPARVEQVVRGSDGKPLMITSGDEVIWRARRTRRPVTVEEAEEALQRDVRASLAGAPGSPGWIVLVRYTQDGPNWIDAAWPTLSIATADDQRSIARDVAENGTWDWVGWTTPEHHVELTGETQEILEALDDVVSVDEIPNVLRRVTARLADAGPPEVIFVASDWDVLDLRDALKLLPAAKRDQLSAVGALPAG